MGDALSKTDKGVSKREIKDVLKFLGEEVKKWDDNIKNLKESLEKRDNDWISLYLTQNMKETEHRWINIKSSVLQVQRSKGQDSSIWRENHGTDSKQPEDSESSNHPVAKDSSQKEITADVSDHTKNEKEIKELQKKLSMAEDAMKKQKMDLEQSLRQKSEENEELMKHVENIKVAAETQRKKSEANFEKEKKRMFEEKHVLMAEKESLQTQADYLQNEKDALLLRLSKIAAERLLDNNPAVADLSDPNRPTKLGEFYTELYDNEWTDACEALKAVGYQEETAIETLRLTLENVVQFCMNKAELVIKKSSDAVNLLFEEYKKTDMEEKMPPHLTMPRKQGRECQKLMHEQSSIEDIRLQQRWKPREHTGGNKNRFEKGTAVANPKLDAENKLKLLRKELATSVVPIVQQAYMDANWTNDCVPELKPYIMKCVFLGWMMVVQSPPLVLHKYPNDQVIAFDKNLYREYTATGPVVSFIVWPALLLEEDGAVLMKGVAEGKKPDKEKTSDKS